MAARRKTAKGGVKAAREIATKRSTPRRAGKRRAEATKRNAYLQAILHNDRVHERVQTGIGLARAAYGRVSRRGKGADALFGDRRARRDLGRALVAFQEAAAIARAAKLRRRRRVGVRTVLPVVALGGAVAVVVNEELREKVIGLVSGSSEDSGPGAGGSPTTSDSGGAVERGTTAENAPPTVQEG